MGLLTRYILLELIKVFSITLMGMTIVVLLACVAQEAVIQGLSLWPICRLIPYFLPNALVYAVPGTILFAACSVYGRMAAENEIVAAKSLGISVLSFLGPGFILAFLVSLTAVWLNDVAASWGRKGVQRVLLQSVEQIAYGMLRTQRAYSTDRFSIHVADVEGRTLVRPMLRFHSDGDSPSFTLTAEEAELHLNSEKDALNVRLVNSEVEWGEDWVGDLPGYRDYEVPLAVASRKGGHSSSPSACAMHEIPQRIDEQRDQIQTSQQQFAAQAAFQLLMGDFPELAGSQWKENHRLLRKKQHDLFSLDLVSWRRWANGFSCLFFVMVGAPFAIRLRNADIWTTFGLCFLPILLVYYPLLMYGLDRAKSGDLPSYCIWLGNLVLFGVGIWMVRRVMRY